MGDAQFPSEFGQSFQETLIYCVLTDPKFSSLILDIIEPYYFRTIYLQYLMRLISDYKHKYKVMPPKDILVYEIKSQYKKDIKLVTEMLSCVNRVFNSNDGLEYVKEHALDFCRVQKVNAAIMEVSQLINSKRCNFEKARQRLMQSFVDGSDKTLTNYKETFEDRVEAVTVKVPRIPTGLINIDQEVLYGSPMSHGGLPVKKLGIIITFTSGGKSNLLVNIGSAAMRHGYTVLHITLEDDENDIALRYDANLSGMPYSEFLYSSTKQQIVKNVLGQVPGKLFIKEYPGRSASVLTIRNNIDRMISYGKKPDILLVDYISEIKPSEKRERRHELADIARDLRALAVEYEMVVWTAAQSQRGTVRRKIVRLEQIGEAFEITHPADFILTIGQTTKDSEENLCKLFVAKNKTGPDMQVFVAEYIKNLSRFRIMKQIDASVLEIDSIGFGFQEDSI